MKPAVLLLLLTVLAVWMAGCGHSPLPKFLPEEPPDNAVAVLSPSATVPRAPATVSATLTVPAARKENYQAGRLYLWHEDTLFSLPADCIILSTVPCPAPAALLTSTTSHAPLRWSRDGRLGAVFVSQPGDQTATLYIYNPQTGTWNALLKGPYGNALAWSPDGLRLAFSTWVEEQNGEQINHVYIARVDDSTVQNVTSALPGIKSSFTWVNADTLAFSVFSPRNRIDDIYLYSLTNSNITKITPWQDAEMLSSYDSLTYLSDGILAFTAWGGGDIYQPDWKSFLGQFDDSRVQELPALPSLHVWSPDRRWAMGITWGDPRNNAPDQLTLFSRRDLSSRTVLSLDSCEDWAWSPDSRYVLIQGYEEWWLLSITGQAVPLEDRLERVGISAFGSQSLSWGPP